MFKNILITGGYGFLGQYVVKTILDEYPQVHIKIVDVKASDLIFDFNSDQRTTSSFVDILQTNDLAAEFKDIDVVIHLVGMISSSVKDKEKMFNVNVDGTENVLQAMILNKVSRLIHISSVAALGYRTAGDEPIDEGFQFDWDIARRRKKYYMLTKHLADVKVAEYSKKGIDAIVLHPSLMYGPGDRVNTARLIQAIKTGKIPFNAPGGTSVIHVVDVARGVLAALKRETFNGHFLLSGYNHSFIEINRIIAEQVGVSPPQKTLPRFVRPALFRLLQMAEMLSPAKLQLCADDIDNSFRERYYDNSKARQQLGWEPTIPFEQTIAETIKWMQENGYLDE